MPPSLLLAVVSCVLVAAVATAPVAQAADPRDVKVKGKPAPEESDAETADDAKSMPAPAGDTIATDRGIPRAWLANTDMFNIRRRPDKARSAFWFPFLTFWVPGLDQWIEGQFVPAIAYTTTSVAGYAYIDHVKNQYGLYEKARAKRLAIKNGTDTPDSDSTDELNSKDSATRQMALAAQVSQWAGGMSAYHSFRTAVRTRKQFGEYTFLTSEETPFDLMAAPFHVEYMLRPTTFIPLAIIAGISALNLRTPIDESSDLQRDRVTGDDVFYASAFSYNAGTHEEAMFRGWLQPWLMEQLDSNFQSNAIQSLAFGAAHLGTNSLPIIQVLLGYHLGWVNQRNGYLLSEGIFIHAWWDVVAFITAYNYKEKPTVGNKTSRLARPTLWLPPVEFSF